MGGVSVATLPLHFLELVLEPQGLGHREAALPQQPLRSGRFHRPGSRITAGCGPSRLPGRHLSVDNVTPLLFTPQLPTRGNPPEIIRAGGRRSPAGAITTSHCALCAPHSTHPLGACA